MRNQVNDIQHFCEELELEAKTGNVYKQAVYFRVDTWQDTKHEGTAIIQVNVWATALIREETGDYILEFGEHCGEDDKNSHSGSERAATCRSTIDAVARRYDLRVRHGKLEVI
jgi:hypothetical protein